MFNITNMKSLGVVTSVFALAMFSVNITHGGKTFLIETEDNILKENVKDGIVKKEKNDVNDIKDGHWGNDYNENVNDTKVNEEKQESEEYKDIKMDEGSRESNEIDLAELDDIEDANGNDCENKDDYDLCLQEGICNKVNETDPITDEYKQKSCLGKCIDLETPCNGNCSEDDPWQCLEEGRCIRKTIRNISYLMQLYKNNKKISKFSFINKFPQ